MRMHTHMPSNQSPLLPCNCKCQTTLRVAGGTICLLYSTLAPGHIAPVCVKVSLHLLQALTECQYLRSPSLINIDTRLPNKTVSVTGRLLTELTHRQHKNGPLYTNFTAPKLLLDQTLGVYVITSLCSFSMGSVKPGGVELT